MSYQAAASRHLQKGEVKNGYNRLGGTAEPVDRKNNSPLGANERPVTANRTEKAQFNARQTQSKNIPKPNEVPNAWLSDSRDKKKDIGKLPPTSYYKPVKSSDSASPKQQADPGKDKKTESKIDPQQRAKGSLVNTSAFAENIGKLVSVKLLTGRTVEGKVFYYDQTCNVAVIMNHPNSSSTQKTQPNLNSNPNSKPSTPSNTYASMIPGLGSKPSTEACVNIITISNVSKVTVIDSKNDQQKTKASTSSLGLDFQLPQVKHLPVEKLRIVQHKLLSEARDQFLRIGENVSSEAQSIFDALSKTLPCRWDGNNIIVLDEITIKPPYDVDSCSSTADSDTLDRVKKVLHGEKQRLAIISMPITTLQPMHQ